jgi:hypothetical protein
VAPSGAAAARTAVHDGQSSQASGALPSLSPQHTR